MNSLLFIELPIEVQMSFNQWWNKFKKFFTFYYLFTFKLILLFYLHLFDFKIVQKFSSKFVFLCATLPSLHHHCYQYRSSISLRGLSNCYAKGSFASEVHRERIGRSLCVTLYAAWLQFAAPAASRLSFLSSLTPPPCPRFSGAYRVSRCRAHHGYVYVLVSDTYGDQTEYTEH